MAKQRKAWMVGPAKQPRASLPGTLKDEVDTRAVYDCIACEPDAQAREAPSCLACASGSDVCNPNGKRSKAGDLIEGVLKPRHVKSPPEGSQFNYITDITTKWIGSTC